MANESSLSIPAIPATRKSNELQTLLASTSRYILKTAAQLYIKATYGTGSVRAESYGSFLATAGFSMKNMLEYMRTNAGVVEQFRVVQEMFPCKGVNTAPVPSALLSFFQRIHASGITHVYKEWESVPKDIELIMTQYWVWLRNSNLPIDEHLTELIRKMQIKRDDSILNKSHRVVLWERSGTYDPHNVDKFYKINKTWLGKSVAMATNDVTTFDTSSIKLWLLDVTNKTVPVKAYVWCLFAGNAFKGQGVKDNKEDACEELYHCFFDLMTKFKYREASLPLDGKEVVVYGNWLSEEEFLSKKMDKNKAIRTDMRTMEVFCVGLPSLQKETYHTKIIDYKITSRYAHSHLDYLIEIEEGLELTSEHCRVYNTQRYVNGEVYCSSCKQLYESPVAGDVCEVRGYMPMCGPCRDELALKIDLESLVDPSF
jgi:hypothetical protein